MWSLWDKMWFAHAEIHWILTAYETGYDFFHDFIIYDFIVIIIIYIILIHNLYYDFIMMVMISASNQTRPIKQLGTSPTLIIFIIISDVKVTF